MPTHELTKTDLMKTELLERLKTLSLQKGDFVLASGKRSNYYIDCRMTTLDGRGSYLIGHLLYDIIADLGVDAVGGMSMGADPMVTAITYRSAEAGKPMPGFLIRKESKGHGTGRQVEGHLKPWMRVVLVEDVVTTGGSTLKAIEAVKRTHPSVEIVHVLALVDRHAGGAGAFSALRPDPVPFQALYSVDELLRE